MGATHQALLMIGAGVESLSGALCNNDSLWMDREVYDNGGYHESVTNPTRLTAPANGLYRLNLGLPNATGVIVRSSKNGSIAYNGRAGVQYSQSNADLNAWGAIVTASASDYFTIPSSGFDTPIHFMGIEKIDPATKLASYRKSASTQSLTANVSADVTFDAAMESNGSSLPWTFDGTKFTITADCRVKLSTNVELVAGNVVASFQATIAKAGAGFRGGGVMDTENTGAFSTTLAVNIVSATVDAVIGDEFKVIGICSVNNTITNNEGTWFQIEVVPNYPRCLVYPSSGQALTGGVDTLINYDSTVYDAWNMHDASQPERIYIPSGYNYARAIGNMQTGSVTGASTFRQGKNGITPAIGQPSNSSATGGTDFANLKSAWIPVVGGTDYLTQRISSATGNTLTVGNHNWFFVECRP